METIIRLKATELDFVFFRHLKGLIKKDDSIEIIITTASTESEILKPESDAEMRNRIDRAIEEVESGADLITLSKEELDFF